MTKHIPLSDVSLSDWISRAVALDENNKTWPIFGNEEVSLSRDKVVTASEAYTCVRRLAYKKLYPQFSNLFGPDFNPEVFEEAKKRNDALAAAMREQFEKAEKEGDGVSHLPGATGWGAGQRGHSSEAWNVEKLMTVAPEGWELEFAAENQVSLVNMELRVSGTPDGLLLPPEDHPESDQGVLLEFKGFDPRSNVANFPKPAHVAQVNVNMALLNTQTSVKVNEAILLYTDAADYEHTHEFRIKYDGGESFAMAAVKARAIFETSKSPEHHVASLPAQGIKDMTGCCQYCAFTAHCSKLLSEQKDKDAEKVKMGGKEKPKLAAFTGTKAKRSVISRFIDLKKRESDVKAGLAALDEEVRQTVFNEPDHTLHHNGATLTVTETPGRVSIDKKKMKADGIDVSAYEKVGKPFLTLKVDLGD